MPNKVIWRADGRFWWSVTYQSGTAMVLDMVPNDRDETMGLVAVLATQHLPARIPSENTN